MFEQLFTILPYLLFILLCILQVLDVYSTYRVIATGKGREANPVMLKVMNVISSMIGKIYASPPAFAYIWVGLSIPKLVIMGALFWCITITHVYLVLGVLVFLTLLYAYVVWNNFNILHAAVSRR